jgi:predicted RNA-binding Zn-ribbon protein involved in translation (DUF1610 family)
MGDKVGWQKALLPFSCAKCGKMIKPGRKVGRYQGRTYCYRCGHNIELATDHRFVSSVNTRAMRHLMTLRGR